MPRKESRFSAWRARLSDRLARSSRVFLLGLIVACGIEVLVDWNQTLFEINVLRSQIHQKGINYAGLLARAVAEPMRIGDRASLERLSIGILDDEDAVYVRLSDLKGQVIYDQVDDLYAKEYEKRGKGTFVYHYAHWLERDVRGVLEDLDGFKERLAKSRYRDLPQAWTDVSNRIMAAFSSPAVHHSARAQIVYQDRLRDENHQRDDTTSWAIARLERDGQKLGTVLVAFDMTRTNRAVRMKYLKGIGMVAFFVGLILVQNIIARRDKLRLLELEGRHAGAKRALRTELPMSPISTGEISVYGALEQAKETVDGMVWDAAALDETLAVLIADPDGEGIDAAAIGLHMLRSFRARSKAGGVFELTIDEEVAALGAATHGIPLTRPIGILLLRIKSDGSFYAVMGDFAALHILEAGNTVKSHHSVVAIAKEGKPPDGIIGPLFCCQGTLPPGATLLCLAAGKGVKDVRIDSDALSRYLLRSRRGTNINVDDAAIWARGKSPALSENDIAVVAIRRA